MSAHNKKSDIWSKNLKFISHCPVCGRDYKSEGELFDLTKSCRVPSIETRRINKSEARFVHFTCAYCRSHFMAMVMMMPKGMSTVGMVTDLNLKDVQKLCKMPPLTIDETIEAHKMLHSSEFYTKLSLI